MPTLDPEGKYLMEVWRDHVYPLAEKMNLPLRKPAIQPRTRLAHVFSKWVSEQSFHTECHVALFRAFLQNGLDIGKIEILEQIALDLQLPAESLQARLENNRYLQQVLEDIDTALQVGVRAVPAFVYGNRLLAAGVQTVSRLQEILKRTIPP